MEKNKNIENSVTSTESVASVGQRLFKRYFGLPLLVWLVLTSVSFALVVNYISNTISASVTVEKGLKTRFVDASEHFEVVNENLIQGNIYAGDVVWFKYETKNRANREILRYPVIEVRGVNVGLSEGLHEIEQVIYRDANYPDGINITNYLFCVLSNNVVSLRNCPSTQQGEWLRLYFDNSPTNPPQPYPIQAGQTLWNNITLFINATMQEGTYQIRYVELFDLYGPSQ